METPFEEWKFIEELAANQHDFIRTPVSADLCGTAIFGILLDYPVIYHYDMASFNGNMSGIPLNVYTAAAEFVKNAHDKQPLSAKLFSFSVPKALDGYNDSISPCALKSYIILNGEESAEEARGIFQEVLALNPGSLRALRALESTSNLLVSRWHFPMLNDERRNSLYRDAIDAALKSGVQSVLDIGTGTGFLSYLVWRSNPAGVYACEMNTTMYKIASEVLKKNNADVQLIPKKSTDLLIPDDLPERVDLVICEIFDAGLLGEGALETLSHAWENLINPSSNSRVIPSSADVFLALVESPDIAQSSCGKKTCLLKEEPYDSEVLSSLPRGFRILSTPTVILHLNFCDPEELVQIVKNGKKSLVDIELKVSGVPHAAVIWFDLHLNEHLTITTHPSDSGCWEQAIFPLGSIDPVLQGNVLTLAIDVCDYISVELASEPNPRLTPFPSPHLKVINDDLYLGQIQLELKQLLGDLNQGDIKILDLHDFPVAAIVLKECGLKSPCTVYTVETLCENVYGEDVKVISSEQAKQERANIVFHDPISKDGTLNPYVLSLLQQFPKETKFQPSHVEAWGYLFESQRLEEMSRLVSDERTLGYAVAEFLNRFSVSYHVDLHESTLPKLRCSDDFYICDIFPCLDYSGVDAITVTTSGSAVGIMVFFRLCYSSGLLCTKDVGHHWKHMCCLFPEPTKVVQGTQVGVLYKVSQGEIYLAIQ
ncbi:unnamed protein product [Darwinula stevensoni]|uniref:Methyltransferase domain-containing protein n=1 Tax=Darwinula stevensoni TaxID=69355 RepID=A0A7R8XDH9_9CRUS|nr:unnamed protein product [Darwinula stevensoni]CAG0888697.1 unnamed protein product [Darwinula stevensoni]